jgi:hypothetical protein
MRNRRVQVLAIVRHWWLLVVWAAVKVAVKSNQAFLFCVDLA